jgi:hypothetical protein
MLQFELLTLELFFLSFLVLNSEFFESVVVSFVIVKFLLVEVHDLVAGNVQKLSGVRNNNYSAFAVGNVVLEPHNCV